MNVSETQRLLKALSFAADKHRFQTRKDSAGTPYINHPIDVALTLVEIGGEQGSDLLVAAILHDTIEDTETSPDEIERLFGKSVLDIVLEVTDDKTLPKAQRKQLQVTQASGKSQNAKKLKLADKLCNVNDIIHHPPGDWNVERKLKYFDWAESVLEGLANANPKLEQKLSESIATGRKSLSDRGQ
jgi:guanosine-3',5'-bis(diphosphate) 3'-pyrophosphohydrolase